ncbi:MAG TPA: OmpA family protein [Patescibacteria group bacterium]|nr:OmpA family protein [Patescibacteria group bacterium]
MRGVMRVAVVVPAMALLISGCATKDWVKDLVGKREAEIDQRVGTRVGSVETRLGEESQRVTRVEGQIGETTQRLNGVEAQAGQASETAKAARVRADEVDTRLTRLWSSRNKRSLVETVHVQFAFDKAELSDAAQTALATIVKELKENPNLTVDLEGFTDQTGARDYNVTLSQRRVESVRRFLVEQGAELPRINSVGLGPVTGAKEEQAKQRRVSVKLMLGAD